MKKGADVVVALFPEVVFKLNTELMHGDELLRRFTKRPDVAYIDKYVKLSFAESAHALLAYKFQQGFSMVKHFAEAEHNALFCRKNPRESNLYEFIFPHPDETLTIEKENREFSIGCSELYDGFWLSPGMEFKLHMNKGDRIEFLSIVFDAEVLESIVSSDNDDYIRSALQDENGFFFAEKVNVQFYNDLKRIFSQKGDDIAGMIELEGLTKIVIARFLQAVVAANSDKPKKELNATSLERARKVKEIIHFNLSEKPVITDLAKELGSNRVTLQKEFQTAFGSSIYQYYKDARMYEALTMLSSGDYSVSEVCYYLGYKSLGHFSKSFLEKHGANPSDYIPK